MGCTPLCRAIGEMYANPSLEEEIVQSISPACQVIVTALNDPACPADIRNYAVVKANAIFQIV